MMEGENIDFDVAKMDAFARGVIGAPKKSGPNLQGLNSVLAERVKKASSAYFEKYGEDLPVTSGVRTKEEQQELYNKWKAGEPGVYMPLNPADYPDRQVFHENNVDISQAVPEEFLNSFGIHRPLGEKDPVHAGLMPNFKDNVNQNNQEQPPQVSAGQESNDEIDFDIDKMDAFARNAVTEKPPEFSGNPLISIPRQVMALADNVYGVVPGVLGLAAYGGKRGVASYTGENGELGGAPEEAKKFQNQVVQLLEKPLGKLFNITDTPEYKYDLSTRFLNFVGENIEKGSDFIAAQTGLAKEDAEYGINVAMTLAPFLGKTKAGKSVGNAIKTKAGLVADSVKHVAKGALENSPNFIKRPIEGLKNTTSKTYNWAAENLGTKLPENILPPDDGAGGAGTGTSGGGGIPSPTQFSQAQAEGAAGSQPGTTNAPLPEKPNATFSAVDKNTPETIASAVENASPALKENLKKIPKEKLNQKAIARHLEADSLDVPVQYSEGQALRDPWKISLEKNDPKNAEFFNNQNKALTKNLDVIKQKAAPNTPEVTPIESGQTIIDSYKALDDAKNQQIKEAYKALEDASGGQIPIDGVKLASLIEENLAKKLKSDFLSPAIKKQLERFKKGAPMTFEQLEAMRTNLAAEIRKAQRAGDGNASAAAGIAREALESLPLKDGVAESVNSLAEGARKLARERFELLKKDPAYKAAVNESVPADNFLNKFVVKGVNKNIKTMLDTLGRDSLVHENIKSGVLKWISEQTGLKNGEGNFKQSGYNKALKHLSDVKNLEEIFDPVTKQKLQKLGRVAFETQFQPEGHFVNNSKTFVAQKAAQALETGLNMASPFSLGTKLKGIVDYANEAKVRKKSFSPGAGSSLGDIKNIGKKK